MDTYKAISILDQAADKGGVSEQLIKSAFECLLHDPYKDFTINTFIMDHRSLLKGEYGQQVLNKLFHDMSNSVDASYIFGYFSLYKGADKKELIKEALYNSVTSSDLNQILQYTFRYAEKPYIDDVIKKAFFSSGYY